MSKNEQYNEKNFSKRLNIQLCELLQVLTETNFER